ncbi:MAG: histidine phosphotransferase family protein [Proteobacteria bacterium]|nr:histidine phosphotransferase family protein [Pseudomonadota bacterium]
MGTSNLNLAGLIGSRICHDLISPIGAIGNGLELLEMRGAHDGVELDLIARSAVQARARIAFYRLAFGHGGDDLVARREIVPLLDDLLAGGRIVCDWGPEDPCPRAGVRLAFLAFMCCESALPYGGTVRIAQEGGGWRIAGDSARLQVDPTLWSALASGRVAPDIAPAHVQFALLPEVARDQGRTLSVTWNEGSVRIGF